MPVQTESCFYLLSLLFTIHNTYRERMLSTLGCAAGLSCVLQLNVVGFLWRRAIVTVAR